MRLRRLTGLTAFLVSVGVAAVSPGFAFAGVNAGIGITFPDRTPTNNTVTVGDTGIAASLSLINLNTPPNAGDTNTVCNAGGRVASLRVARAGYRARAVV